MKNFKKDCVKKLINLMKNNELTEITIEEGDSSITIFLTSHEIYLGHKSLSSFTTFTVLKVEIFLFVSTILSSTLFKIVCSSTPFFQPSVIVW